MRLLLVVLALLATGFLLLDRERLYVRDPLATVYRSEAKQRGVQVFINYSNDVLLEQDEAPGAFRTLVQAWNHMPGTPVVLKCIRWMVCLTEADRAATLPMEWSGKGTYDPQLKMGSHEVTFRDGDGTRVRVER